jgi:hypothetical protein
MKIIVHDYAGHPFQVQLSRQLAARGHEVLHLYCASTHTPRGELERRSTDPPNFTIRAIELSAMIPKNNFVRRYFLEVDYAKKLVAEVERSGAEVILSGNTPSIPQQRLAPWCRGRGVRLVSWVQDIWRPGDPARLVASSARAERDLGWRPALADIRGIVESAWRFSESRR